MSKPKIPLFVAVLDVKKMMSVAGNNPDLKQSLNQDIKALLTGPVGSLIDNDAAERLLKQYGPKSSTPCTLNRVMVGGENMPKFERDVHGDIVAHYAFSDVVPGTRPTIDDARLAVSTKALFSPAENALLPAQVLCGSESSGFIMLMYQSCCAHSEPTMCALTVINQSQRFLTGWKVSPRAIENGMQYIFTVINEHGDRRVTAYPASEKGDEQIFHQMHHAGGFGHDCKSHAKIDAGPVWKP